MKSAAACLIAMVFALSARAADSDKSMLTLDEALRIARATHPQAQAARAQTEASAARVGEARAPLLPQLSGIAYAMRSYGPSSSSSSGSGTGGSGATSGTGGTSGGTGGSSGTTGVSSGSSGISGNDMFYMGLTASQLIYDFGQTTGKLKAAKATLKSQEESERNSVAQVVFNLRSAYFTAAAARALLKVAEETVRNQNAHLRQIQGFVEAGTRPEIDLAQSRTDLANAKVQLINAQVAYDTDKALLNQAMGIERDTSYDVADPGATPVPNEDKSTDDLLPTALAARPDLLILARQVEAQELSTGALKGAYAPSLSASTTLSESGPGLDDLNWGWSARLSLGWSIFGGWITDQQVRESRATTAALRAQYELQRQQVRVDVEQARLAVRATKAAIEAAHEAAVNARIRLTLAEGRYQAGVGSSIELGDSQVAMTTAAAQEVQAIFNLAIARAKLLLAIGQP